MKNETRRSERLQASIIVAMNRVIRSNGTDLASIRLLNSEKARPINLAKSVLGKDNEYVCKTGRSTPMLMSIGDLYKELPAKEAGVFAQCKSFQNSKQTIRGYLQALDSNEYSTSDQLNASIVASFKTILSKLQLLEV